VSDRKAVALRALACLDLTDLAPASGPAEIDRLCERAISPHGAVAAVCVLPRFVARARAALAGTAVRVATVINFPGGDRPDDFMLAMTADVLDDGAEEIDLVIPWKQLLLGQAADVAACVRRIRRASGTATLKTILETGRLLDPGLIRQAADIAVAEGTDFLKTSTGMVEINATPEAVGVLLEAIRAADRPVGLKPSGGIRSTDDAAGYLAQADAAMGPDWARPETFRLGASSLLDALIATIEGRESPAGGTVY
jgi:deoxyribose-phosphate aldolase